MFAESKMNRIEIKRMLKKYITDEHLEDIGGRICPECGGEMNKEACPVCTVCGYTKCS